MRGLKRAKRDRWIMGVCGGIAHRYGWNSTVVRLVTIVLAIIIPGFSVISPRRTSTSATYAQSLGLSLGAAVVSINQPPRRGLPGNSVRF
jgi:phage shock protein PspC (stress-responsive transcriptional regulator)